MIFSEQPRQESNASAGLEAAAVGTVTDVVDPAGAGNGAGNGYSAYAPPMANAEAAPSESLDGWVFADRESVLNSSAAQVVTVGGQPEDMGSVDAALAQMLRVEAALAHPGVPAKVCKLDAVLSVIAPAAEATARAPLRLVAVLDKSGSMNGEKMRLVIETVKFMLQHLTERDALGLVAFDTSVQVLAPLTFCNAEGRSRLEAVISGVKAGSQTNLSGGLLRGLELHGDNVREPGSPFATKHQVTFGNRHELLSDEDPAIREDHSVPAGVKSNHKWTMELRTENSEDAALIEKVVYTLHSSFRNPIVEVFEAPYRLTRVGWGIFDVQAVVHFKDGRVSETLKHTLCFNEANSFRTKHLSVPVPPPALPVLAELEDDQAIVRSTFLFTDGVANVGIKDSSSLCKAVNAACAELGNKQCTISTFGFGSDHSEELLKNIAQTGKGVYCFVENADCIGEAFGEALGGLLSVTHQNVRLCLELAPGVRLGKARTKYTVEGPVLSENGWQCVNVELGDLFAEERRDILVELALPGVEVESLQQLGRFRVRGFSVLATCSETTNYVELAVERQLAIDSVEGRAHPQVERHRNRYIASESLEASRAAAKRMDLEGARSILKGAMSSLNASSAYENGCPLTKGLVDDLNDCFADLRSQEAYRSMGSKKMASMGRAHEMQRTCGGTSTAHYCNSSGLTMKSIGMQISSRSGP